MTQHSAGLGGMIGLECVSHRLACSFVLTTQVVDRVQTRRPPHPRHDPRACVMIFPSVPALPDGRDGTLVRRQDKLALIA